MFKIYLLIVLLVQVQTIVFKRSPMSLDQDTMNSLIASEVAMDDALEIEAEDEREETMPQTKKQNIELS